MCFHHRVNTAEYCHQGFVNGWLEIYKKKTNLNLCMDVITDRIECPEQIELFEESPCLILDEQALVVSFGKPQDASTFGCLADVFVNSVLTQRVIENRSVPVQKNWSNFIAMPENKADLARFDSKCTFLKRNHSCRRIQLHCATLCTCQPGYNQELCLNTAYM